LTTLETVSKCLLYLATFYWVLAYPEDSQQSAVLLVKMRQIPLTATASVSMPPDEQNCLWPENVDAPLKGLSSNWKRRIGLLVGVDMAIWPPRITGQRTAPAICLYVMLQHTGALPTLVLVQQFRFSWLIVTGLSLRF
jgi:hypothetical protein